MGLSAVGIALEVIGVLTLMAGVAGAQAPRQRDHLDRPLRAAAAARPVAQTASVIPEYIPTHWTSKAFPGKPNIDLWGWHNGTTYQKEPVYSGTPAYVQSNIIDESSKWGANFLNVYPTYVIGGPQIPMTYTTGDPIPSSWLTVADPNWDIEQYKNLISYAHDRGMSLDCFSWMTNDPNKDYWEWLFRETGNVLRDGVKNAWDGFEEEYYSANDGSITERALRYNPGAFTAITPGSFTNIPTQTAPLFINGVMCAVARYAGTRCAGQTDQPLKNDDFGWLGGAAWQPTVERPYLGFQADTRFLKPRTSLWSSWGVFGGGNYIDAFMKQANDFARRRLYRSDNSSTALWWLNESTATTPEFLRNAIYGISQDPIRSAITTRLVTTGVGGVADTIVPGKASFADRWDTALIQNNYFRISRRADLDRGKLTYDRDIAAHYDNHNNAESATDNVVLSTNLFRTDAPTLSVSEPSDLPITLGVRDGSNAEFSFGGFDDVINFDLDTQSAAQFPATLSEIGYPSKVNISFSATPGNFRFKLRKTSGTLYAYVLMDDDVIGFIDGENDVYFGVTESGTCVLTLWCDGGTQVGVDVIEILKISNRAIRHSFVEEAGYCAVLREVLETVGDTQTLSETRTYTVLNDAPYQTLELARQFDTGTGTVNSVIGCEGYDTLIAGGTTYSTDHTFIGSLPDILRLVDTGGLKPELAVFVQDAGNASSLAWTASGSLEFSSNLGTAIETQGFQFVVSEGIYTSSEYSELKSALDTDILATSFGASSTIVVSNPAPIPVVKLISISDAGDEPCFVLEKGVGQSDSWWMFRGLQASADGSSDYLRVYLAANGSATIQKFGYGYVEGKVKPGWGCQHIMAIRDDLTATTATVEVIDVTPMVNAPRVMFNSAFDTVTINGNDWRYFDDNVVFLPNQRGVYTVTVSNNGAPRPRIISTALNVSACSWNAANKRLDVTATHPVWYGSQWPPALNYKLAVLSEGLLVSTIDNGGAIAPRSDYRVKAANYLATFSRGRIVNVNPGTTHISFDSGPIYTSRLRAPLQPWQAPRASKVLHLQASEIDPFDTTDEVRIDGPDVYVKNWEDQSVNNNDASQSTIQNQPLYVANGIGGQPAVEFDGNNDHMDFLDAIIPTDANFTAFIVFSANRESVRGGLLSQYAGGQSYRLSWEANSGVSGVESGKFYPFINGITDGGGPGGSSSDFDYTQPSIFEMTADGGSFEGSRTYQNGILMDDFTLRAVYDGPAVLGGEPINTVFYDGLMAEVIVFAKALSNADRSSIGNYLADKYGIATSY